MFQELEKNGVTPFLAQGKNVTHGLDAFGFITGKDVDIGKPVKLVLFPKNVKDIVYYLDEKQRFTVGLATARGFGADTPPRTLKTYTSCYLCHYDRAMNKCFIWYAGDQDRTRTDFLSGDVLNDLIDKGIQFCLLVLTVGDVYAIPKGVGHFFVTLSGTTHSVIGMQTVIKRRAMNASGHPAPGYIAVSAAEYDRMQTDFRDAKPEAQVSTLFASGASTIPVTAERGNPGQGLFAREAISSPQRLPVCGTITLWHELTESLLRDHRGRILLTAWCLEAEQVRTGGWLLDARVRRVRTAAA